MRSIVRLALLLAVMSSLFGTGWVSYSAEKQCPWPPKPPEPLTTADFMKAHSITQQNYSIWLQEHSAWRRQNAEELKTFSFIPKDFNTQRK